MMPKKHSIKEGETLRTELLIVSDLMSIPTQNQYLIGQFKKIFIHVIGNDGYFLFLFTLLNNIFY